MAREENMLILKMLQEGTITAEQAAELLSSVEKADSRSTAFTASVPPVPPVPPIPPTPPVPPTPPAESITTDFEWSWNSSTPEEETETDTADDPLARARARIAAARQRVSGVGESFDEAQAKLDEAEARLDEAEAKREEEKAEKGADKDKDKSGKTWTSVSDALKDVPGAKAVSDVLRDPARFAANARRQARRISRQVRSAVGDLNLDIHLNLGESLHGEPTFSAAREATVVLEPGTMLRVRNPLGDIEAVGADVPEVRAAGVLKIWASDKAQAEQIAEQITLSVEQTGEGPSLVVSHSPKARRIVLDLKVFVPQNEATISLLSPAGDVSVRNHKGRVVLATQSGDARASEVSGDVAVETASGDIAIEGVTGDVKVSSASGDVKAIRFTGSVFSGTSQSGDVTLRDSTVPTVSIETVSGDADVRGVSGQTLRLRVVSGDADVRDSIFTSEAKIDTVSGSVSASLRGPIESGRIALASVSGDVDLNLPKVTNATLELSTKGGDVQGRFSGIDGTEKTVTGSGMVNLSETVGAGTGARVSLASVSGDLSVKQESSIVEMS